MFVKFLSRQTLPLVYKAGVRRNGGLQEAPSAGVDPDATFDAEESGPSRISLNGKQRTNVELLFNRTTSTFTRGERA
jgi:hypothetical protein